MLVYCINFWDKKKYAYLRVWDVVVSERSLWQGSCSLHHQPLAEYFFVKWPEKVSLQANLNNSQYLK